MILSGSRKTFVAFYGNNVRKKALRIKYVCQGHFKFSDETSINLDAIIEKMDLS